MNFSFDDNKILNGASTSRRRQQGIATILVVMLVGISMTATALGLIYSLKGTQEKQVAVHASTNAQVGLWSGVEAFRRYLGTIPTVDLANLGAVGSVNIDLGSGFGAITAKNIHVTPVGALYHVSTEIVNMHSDSRSSAAVAVTFEVDPNSGGSIQGPDTIINFYDSLELAGQVTFNRVNGVGAKINVEGNLLMGNINVANLDRVNVTGSVSLGSSIQLDVIHSGGKVTLMGGAHANTVLTEDQVETQSGAGADVIMANKAVTLGGTGRSTSVQTLETITVSAGSHGTLSAKGNVNINHGTGTIDEIKTKAAVNVNAVSGVSLTSVAAEGDFNCNLSDWGVVGSLSMNGIFNPNCVPAKFTSLTLNAGVSVTEMSPVTPVTIPPVVIDVWTLRDQANYIFERDTVNNKTKVTVNNINGVTNGSVFYIGNYSDNHKSYLCTAVDASGACTAPATPGRAMCLGHSTWNECVSYGSIDGSGSASSMGWKFDGVSAAPGIMWFKGGVNLNNGKNYATILATGNVITGGQLELYSVNYGGYAGVCTASGAAFTDATVAATYKTLFQNQYPTNLCDKANGIYTPIPLGNIGVAAGGYSGDPVAYSGGKVNLGTSNRIYGAVLAGQTLVTAGQTEVHGYVTAAAQGGKVSAGQIANTLGANSTIDLTTSVDTYDPVDLPMMGNFGAVPVPPPPPADPEYRQKSKVLWTRYL